MNLDREVWAYWNEHGVIPSDIPTDLYDEIADALEGTAPEELIHALRSAG